MAKLKLITSTHRAVVDKGEWVLPKESASQIAARLRDGRGPLRGLVWQSTIDGERE